MKKSGFTLIELSIVLVIIGLFAGGIMVGKDLISAAEIRSQIQQIEKYNAAVNTFKVKYGYLPGDIPDPTASGFGFVARGIYDGEGDGDGIIEGLNLNAVNSVYPNAQRMGEVLMFWVDLSTAKMIDGNFSAGLPNGELLYLRTEISTPSLSDYYPKAKISNGGYIYVRTDLAKQNYYVLSGVIAVNSLWAGAVSANPSLTPQQAQAIDNKIDDGLPQSGIVIATYADQRISAYNGWFWASGGGVNGASTTAATPASATTCFDNGNVAGTQKYSVGTNGGNGMNCALSFKFQ